MTRLRPAALTVSAALAGLAVALAGCSTVEQLTNKGGDTTCGDFNAMDDAKQRSAVSKMLKDRDGNEPSNIELSATRMAASAFCKTIGKDSSKIREAML